MEGNKNKIKEIICTGPKLLLVSPTTVLVKVDIDPSLMKSAHKPIH